MSAELGIQGAQAIQEFGLEPFNEKCRESVWTCKSDWDEFTELLGYWVDLDDPYITFKNEYIETVWWLLKQIHEKGLLYKGYTIQPYSPAAGTGLSSHELNMPGTYKDVKDTSAVAQFKVVRNDRSEFLFEGVDLAVLLHGNVGCALRHAVELLEIDAQGTIKLEDLRADGLTHDADALGLFGRAQAPDLHLDRPEAGAHIAF